MNNFVAMSKCFFCLEAGNIIIHNRFKDISKLHNQIIDLCPCSKCAEHMRQGIIVISIDDKSEAELTQDLGPWRSGGWFVVKEEAIRRILEESTTPKPMIENILKSRWVYMPNSICYRLGIAEQGILKSR